MARRRYPWSTLGLDPTDSERDIKVAYARKLKSTRPEDDPEKFQRLVEARDRAMEMAQRRRQAAAEKMQAADPGEDTDERDFDDPVDVILADADTPAGREPQFEPVSVHPGNSLSPLAPNPALATPEPTQQSDALPAPKAAPTPDAAHALPGGPWSAPAGQPDVQPIIDYLVPDKTLSTYEDAHAALHSIARLSIEQRSEVEPLLLQAAWSYLEATTWRNGERIRIDESRRNTRRDVILLLDEEFGWSHNDRRAQDILGWGSDRFPDALHSLRGNSYAALLNGKTISKKRDYRWILFGMIMLYLLLQALAIPHK